MNTKNAHSESHIVYICSHHFSQNEYWILPCKNGLKVSQIVTHLIEDLFPGTEWHVEVINSLDSIKENVNWIFSSSEEYYNFFQ